MARLCMILVVIITLIEPSEESRWKTVYNSIFSPLATELSRDDVVKNVDILREKLTTKQTCKLLMFYMPAEQLDDVEFWVDIDDPHPTKCTVEFDKLLDKRHDDQCRKASKAMSKRTLPNLETYVTYVRENQFEYCVKRYGSKLESAIANITSITNFLVGHLSDGVCRFDGCVRTKGNSEKNRNLIGNNIAKVLSNYYDEVSCDPDDYDQTLFDELVKTFVFEPCNETLAPCYDKKLSRYASYIYREEYLSKLPDTVQTWLGHMTFCKNIDEEIIEYAYQKLLQYVCRRSRRNLEVDHEIRKVLIESD